jgi:hypothetical protein
MNKITRLHQYLAGHFTLLGIGTSQIQVHPDGGELQPGSGQVDIQRGHHVAGWLNDNRIRIEGLPADSAGYLLTLLQVWLDQHDTSRDQYNLDGPQIDVTPDTVNSHVVTVEIELAFMDELYLVPQAAGPIEISGQRFGFGDYQVAIARTLGQVGSLQDNPMHRIHLKTRVSTHDQVTPGIAAVYHHNVTDDHMHRRIQVRSIEGVTNSDQLHINLTHRPGAPIHARDQIHLQLHIQLRNVVITGDHKPRQVPLVNHSHTATRDQLVLSPQVRVPDGVNTMNQIRAQIQVPLNDTAGCYDTLWAHQHPRPLFNTTPFNTAALG